MKDMSTGVDKICAEWTIVKRNKEIREGKGKTVELN
jgi:hypothetical protein